MMNPNCVRKPEQIKLIMECRQSRLSAYQWCQKQGINPATFYNWVSKLRKAGYMIPDSAGKISDVPGMQEVVKFDLAESEISTPAMTEQSAGFPTLSGAPYIAAEIKCGNIRVRIFYGADADVVQNTFQCFKLHNHHESNNSILLIEK